MDWASTWETRLRAAARRSESALNPAMSRSAMVSVCAVLTEANSRHSQDGSGPATPQDVAGDGGLVEAGQLVDEGDADPQRPALDEPGQDLAAEVDRVRHRGRCEDLVHYDQAVAGGLVEDGLDPGQVVLELAGEPVQVLLDQACGQGEVERLLDQALLTGAVDARTTSTPTAPPWW